MPRIIVPSATVASVRAGEKNAAQAMHGRAFCVQLTGMDGAAHAQVTPCIELEMAFQRVGPSVRAGEKNAVGAIYRRAFCVQLSSVCSQNSTYTVIGYCRLVACSRHVCNLSAKFAGIEVAYELRA